MTRTRFMRLMENRARPTRSDKRFYNIFLKHLLHSAYWLRDPDYIFLERRFKKMIKDDPFQLFTAEA